MVAQNHGLGDPFISPPPPLPPKRYAMDSTPMYEARSPPNPRPSPYGLNYRSGKDLQASVVLS